MSYSKSERIIASVLSNAPFIKRTLKRMYQGLNYLVYRNKESHRVSFPMKRIGDLNKETFFGYYDKSPINKTNRFIIYQETHSSTLQKPQKDIPVDVVLFDIENNSEIKRWNSNAYNWQQGTKLMWISETQFIFNDYDDKQDKYISKIVDINKIDSIITIDSPIYDCHSDFALSLSFERLFDIMPDYGYRNHNNRKEFELNKEGISRINLDDKSSAELILSIDDVISIHQNDNMNNATHWFNHIMISPNGGKFMFLHRWKQNGRKYDALIVANTDGSEAKCLADDGMVSHCFWMNDTEIVSYMRTESDGDKYYQINTNTGNIEVLGNGIIDGFGDGHPNVFGENIVFDTYPNRSRMKELFLYNVKTQNLTEIGAFFESLKYNEETRCDLHPKYSYDGKSIFIDSVHEGKRGLYQINISTL